MARKAANDKNAHYAMLNNRFDERAAQLFKLGFTYKYAEEYGFGVFTRARIGFKVPTSLAASLVMHSDDIVWADRLAMVQR